MIERNFSIKHVDRQRLLTCLGYGKNRIAPESLLQRIDEMTSAAPETLRAVTVSLPITNSSGQEVVTDAGCINSPSFAKLAENGDSVIYGLVTAGTHFDTYFQAFDDMVDSFIADSYGSALVEQGVDLLLEMLGSEMEKHISLPFSPGYCDYPLAEQETVFHVFGERPLGIEYHPESFMMSPVKTISFVAAAGDTPLNTNPCSLCNFASCQNRR